MTQQDIFVSLIHRDNNGQSDKARLPVPGSSSQVDRRTHPDRAPDGPTQILDNNFQRDRFCMRVYLLRPSMVNIFPGDIHVGISIRIYSNDQLDILYSMFYRQHQIVNYTFPPGMLFIWLFGRTVSSQMSHPLSPDL